MSAPSTRVKRWVVRPGDGERVDDVLRKVGESLSAIDEGRVFVGKKRVTRAGWPLATGDEVRIGPPTKPAHSTDVAASLPDVEVLFVRDGLLACIKPAGVPTVPDHAGAAHALTTLAARTARLRPDTLRVTSRLDREVSGVVIFALDDAAEARLRRARAEGRYDRRYLALASAAKALDPEARPWTWPIGRAADPRLRAVSGPDDKPALTRWRAVATTSPASETDVALLAVAPITGRTHQIRLHAATAGAPLLGDRDYGGPTRFTLKNGRVLALSRIALHAARVTVPASDGTSLVVEAPVPESLRRIWADLGGEAEAWNRALSCELA